MLSSLRRVVGHDCVDGFSSLLLVAPMRVGVGWVGGRGSIVVLGGWVGGFEWDEVEERRVYWRQWLAMNESIDGVNEGRWLTSGGESW